MKITRNFHTHTKRCGHAVGEDEEYVVNAIEAGFKELGFTDHVMLPGFIQPGIRMRYEEFDGYRNSILSLKEKYKDKIDIHLGLECEYYEQFEEYYRDLLKSGKVEYLIQGQHCYLDEEMHPVWYLSRPYKEESLRKYADDVVKGMKTGLFRYVAHPDIYVTVFDEWNPLLEELANKICKGAEENNIPLEINVIRKEFKGLRYPCPEFWKVASKYKIKVYVGFDVHSPDAFFNTRFIEAQNIIEKYNFDVVNKD